MSIDDAATMVFALPERLRAKRAPGLIGDDERMFARVRRALAETSGELDARLVRARRESAGSGQHALDRDLEIHRLSSRLSVLGRFGVDACIGRMVGADGQTVYIGRFGLADAEEGRLLVDWRAPAAEPFFAATHADPRGLTSRRRYRWAHARIVDYWDEVFVVDEIDHSPALDDQSAFIASLGASRSPQMRDVLATIQADQDAIIRADSHGALVVDGGPGTGKTVVALHRAAYLRYADARLHEGRGGLLFVGPHRPYLDYIDDVLPSLGEDGVLAGTLADMVAGAANLPAEADPGVRRATSDARWGDAVDAAVALWERPPTRGTTVPTPWGPIAVSAAEWREVFAAAEESASHNAVRVDAWERLLDLLAERVGGPDDLDAGAEGDGADRWTEGWGDASAPVEDAVAAEGEFDAYGLGDAEAPARDVLDDDDQLRTAFDALWPLLDPDLLVRGLWRSPAMLRECASWLSDADAAALAHAAATPWTDAALPILDAARHRVGDPRDEMRARRARAEAASERAVMSDVVSHLIAADDGDMHVMSMLRGQDLRGALEFRTDRRTDPFEGPFAHIVVDEAQELTDAQWSMLVRRNPTRSFTIVGDRAQARHGFRESWRERLARVGIDRVTIAPLTVNYRAPEEVMAVAGPVILAALPDANVPVAIRRSGVAVRYAHTSQLDDIVDAWIAAHAEGTAVVIGASGFLPRERVRSLTPELVKGLEFDLVVIVDPDRFGDGLTGAVDRYVAMTRATSALVILSDG